LVPLPKKTLNKLDGTLLLLLLLLLSPVRIQSGILQIDFKTFAILKLGLLHCYLKYRRPCPNFVMQASSRAPSCT
jgi:hypothetical protein